MNDELLARIQAVKAIYTDVDGILTDGTIFTGSDETEYKQFTVEDGAGAALARRANLIIAFISGRQSEATTIRARQMKVDEVYQGYLNKLGPFQTLLTKHSLKAQEVVFIGDALVDVPVLRRVGVPVSVPGAHPLAVDAAVYITKRKGGRGVLAEVVEWVLRHQNRLDAVLEQMLRDKFSEPASSRMDGESGSAS